MLCIRIPVVLLVFHQAFAYTDTNVLECMKNNDVGEFVQLLEDAKQSVQMTGQGPFTVFAPYNAVLQKYPDVLASLKREPSLVQHVVKFHIINDYAVLPELFKKGSVYSMEGQPLDFTGSLTDIVINGNARPVSSYKTAIICNNGILHIIDNLLFPPLFSTINIPTTLLLRDEMFSTFTMALVLNNLTHMLEGSEFTLFAPTDLGMARYNELMDIPPGTPGAQNIYSEVFKYHIVPGRRTSHELRDGQKLYTFHGYPIEVTITYNGMKVYHANIVDADIAASNGVIHAIDHVLFPRDLLNNLVGIDTIFDI